MQDKKTTLQWRHNGHDGILNHQPHHCLPKRLFGYRSKKLSKLCITGLCAGNSLGTGEFPAQMASNEDTVSIWWRHHENNFSQQRNQALHNWPFVWGIHKFPVDSLHRGPAMQKMCHCYGAIVVTVVLFTKAWCYIRLCYVRTLNFYQLGTKPLLNPRMSWISFKKTLDHGFGHH